jgi:hypothetical protein
MTRSSPAFLLLMGFGASVAAATNCPAPPSRVPAAVVELYTSEGCNSCPPADQWLAGLPNDGSVLALAFHVDYWDDLGWADRFGSAAYTARQRQIQSATGARFVYTPQVVANGRDFPGWRQLAASALPAGVPQGLPAGAPSLALRRDGPQLLAEVGPAADASRLAGYWALVEDGHSSQVGRGENAGRALRHEHVVSRYEPIPAWAGTAAAQWRWTPPTLTPGHAAQAVFVLTDSAGGRPLAARQLRLASAPGC